MYYSSETLKSIHFDINVTVPQPNKADAAIALICWQINVKNILVLNTHS